MRTRMRRGRQADDMGQPPHLLPLSRDPVAVDSVGRGGEEEEPARQVGVVDQIKRPEGACV